jgi:hypothetical protein
MCISRLQPARNTGDAYKQLRALRPLMHRELQEIADCPEAAILPPSAVMHHLLSRAPNDLQSPNTLARMTLAQYSDWLDKHSEAEAWSRIKACLDAYAELVNKRGDKQFHSVYPLLMSLGPRLVASWEQQQQHPSTTTGPQ